MRRLKAMVEELEKAATQRLFPNMPACGVYVRDQGDIEREREIDEEIAAIRRVDPTFDPTVVVIRKFTMNDTAEQHGQTPRTSQTTQAERKNRNG